MRRELVIKIIGSGADLERTSTALSVAAAGVASGVPVTLWLAGDAVWLAVSEAHRSGEADPEALELFATVLPEAPVAVCARCAGRRGLTPDVLRPGAQIQGAAAFVAAVSRPGVQALVY